MSYILDALRKAEHERHLGRPPSLTASPAPVQPTGQRLWLWLAVGLGLGFNAALLAYFLTRPQPATEPATPATTAPKPTQQTLSEPGTPAGVPKPTTEPIGSAPPATAPTQPNSGPPASTPPKTPATVESPPTTAQPAAPRKNPAAASPSEAARPPSAAPVRERRQLSAPKPAPGPTVTIGPEPPPLLETLPAEGRRGLPDLNLDIHVYSPDRDKRFVVVNGRRYREGDPIEKGAVLESVTPNGAVLRQGGQRFRLSVRR
ncbi:MAG TPA: general secretion pathway protein GspB [Candidatus Competibacter sp.]|nr:general secretion pathway protein GspB [Candidatus Competibacter sp.]